jgi:hypothetical protein
MTKKLDPSEIVSFKELLMANSIQIWHEKRRDYCQCFGKHGYYWGCGGMVEVNELRSLF